MEELHFVYINANGRIGVHSIQSISYSENHIQGICKNTDRIKTFRKDRILKQYDSPEQAIQECASHFMMNGGNILVLRDILGHSDIKMTMVYAHFAPDHLEDAVSKNPLYRLKWTTP